MWKLTQSKGRLLQSVQDRGTQGGNQTVDELHMDHWEKLKILSAAAAAVIIPLVLAYLGNQYTSALKERELQQLREEFKARDQREAAEVEQRQREKESRQQADLENQKQRQVEEYEQRRVAVQEQIEREVRENTEPDDTEKEIQTEINRLMTLWDQDNPPP